MSALVQSVWATAKRPRFVEIGFSAAALIVSSGLAYELYHLLLIGNGEASPIARVILAGSIESSSP